ncbi:putative baseplate assembly protein [Paenibacillus mesophilus]|uniref:putative baseplate assembly protein n=1 Tax=Paenibacillus mesophilus TaxID=2582849 RepID=UPI00110E6766|nr:putative baseplate assembly protein [Paenibacillus mesophilus]TMV51552.1 putative baseplate assembly protein [Paenibacillus mesophilus]
MLPLPNLDDRLYEQMLQEARKTIPKLFPQWTDENAHDPGMTMLELMAWMTEMQQYYLNRITAKNERKFLKLLGVKPRDESSAVCEVAFAGASGPITIPRGTPLQAYDQTFETEETLQLVPAVLEKVIVRTETAVGDFTSNLKSGIAFYAFGPEAGTGSRLFVGFDRELPVHSDIVLSVRLSDRYPVPIGRGGNRAEEGPQLIASSVVSWKYAAGDDGDGWKPLETLMDTTAHLSQTGRITFRLSERMKPLSMYPADDKKRYWLCCTLDQEGYELSPKLENLCINAVQAEQRQTISEIVHFEPSGEASFECETTGHLAYTGNVIVQVADGKGRWRDWKRTARLKECGSADACYELERDPSAKSIRLRFGDGEHGVIPAQGQTIRLIAGDPVKEDRLWIGASNGLPEQEFDISRSGTFRRTGMRLQAAVHDSGMWVWEDWEQVDDFDNSKSTDRHYVYDQSEGIIRFGNNEQGAIPPKSDVPNIRFIAHATGGGARGNVKKDRINAFADFVPEWNGIIVTNPAAASGGSEAETLEEAKLRVQRELSAPTRAVTAEDYEAIAGDTPGLRVARVKAIPLYKPGMRDYPREKAQAQMTVVVVPYSESDRPKAGTGFLENVRRHLEPYRLLTTELHVISAAYIKVTVHAVVVVEPSHKEDSAVIANVLKRLLRPMGHGDGEGWRFGRSVHKGDIYGAISRLKGVVYVQDLWIDAEGPSVRKDGSGDIHLPPYGLVYSGEHEIELIGVTDL